MKRAWTLLVLGTLQITGASFSVYMLITTGVSNYTIAGVALTGCVSVASLILKNFVWKKPKQ